MFLFALGLVFGVLIGMGLLIALGAALIHAAVTGS